MVNMFPSGPLKWIDEILGTDDDRSRVDAAIEIALTPIVKTFGKANVSRVLKSMKVK